MPNKFVANEKSCVGKDNYFTTGWMNGSGMSGLPIMWDSEEEARKAAQEQVWNYRIFHFDDDGKLIGALEDYQIDFQKNS